MAETLRTEHLLQPEDCQQSMLWSPFYRGRHHDTVWRFHPFIHKRLEENQARSRHTSLVDRSFLVLCFSGTKQSMIIPRSVAVSIADRCA